MFSVLTPVNYTKDYVEICCGVPMELKSYSTKSESYPNPIANWFCCICGNMGTTHFFGNIKGEAPIYLEELSGEEVYVTEWFDCPPSGGKYRFVISDGNELDGNSE